MQKSSGASRGTGTCSGGGIRRMAELSDCCNQLVYILGAPLRISPVGVVAIHQDCALHKIGSVQSWHAATKLSGVLQVAPSRMYTNQPLELIRA